jgi:hypothetical protein
LTRLADTLRPVSQRPKVLLFIGTYVRTYEVMKPMRIPPVIPGEMTPTFTSMPGATDCPGRLLDARRMRPTSPCTCSIRSASVSTMTTTRSALDDSANAWTHCR